MAAPWGIELHNPDGVVFQYLSVEIRGRQLHNAIGGRIEGANPAHDKSQQQYARCGGVSNVSLTYFWLYISFKNLPSCLIFGVAFELLTCLFV